ncbi:DUF6460 domain-containing protein [Aureimonas sp. Leaf324]|jgi:hypothetical protein|uniref:DUF6460 domain-containing protein n=1 Tax=Aureimonas sp. Leaf324 TaxID=1736336 RepID=UPI0006F2925B|nr:DUF6460 domain-containing protein [Aureimonas sp. Leaf324]KQQ91042.1 hypothetical protein ASF65_00445 [Aureimonas sp. Leaf324]
MADRVSTFLGGSPLSVLVRLLVISLLVGILLSWFDVRPYEIVAWGREFVQWAWYSVFGSLNRVIDYVLLGAAVVVPIFIVSRLLKTGRG